MKKSSMMYLLHGKEYACPIELAVSVFAGRWKISIICQLLQGKKRYGELKKIITGVNHKMLAEQLRELEEAGIVKRKVYPVVPPKVEYELTELGKGLGPVIEYLREWGAHFQIDAAEDSLSSANGS